MEEVGACGGEVGDLAIERDGVGDRVADFFCVLLQLAQPVGSETLPV